MNVPEFIHIGGLILNTSDIEQINMNGKDNLNRECIEIVLRNSTTWNIYRDLIINRKMLVEQLSDKKSINMLIKVKRKLKNKVGRKCKADQLLIDEIGKIV